MFIYYVPSIHYRCLVVSIHPRALNKVFIFGVRNYKSVLIIYLYPDLGKRYWTRGRGHV